LLCLQNQRNNKWRLARRSRPSAVSGRNHHCAAHREACINRWAEKNCGEWPRLSAKICRPENGSAN